MEYRTISHLFGVGISTACIIVHEVCKSIVHVLSQKYIKIHTGPQAMDVVRGFEKTWDFPQCFGAIDGSHIPIIAPTHSPTDYYNRKALCSIVLQALVDHQYRFFNVYVGWPGSVHDAHISSNSEVYKKESAQSYSDIGWDSCSCSDPWRSSISLVTMATQALSGSGSQ